MRIKYIHKELPNKMQVIMVPIPDDTGVAMELSIRAGLALEPENLSGITVLLERIMKEIYPKEYLFNVTSFGFRIYGGGPPDKLKDIFNGMVKVYHKYTFTEHEINIAKEIISNNHLTLIVSDPLEAMYAHVQKTLYLDIPVSNGLVGKQHIDHITKQDIQEFMKAYFRPNNTLFMVFGNFSEYEMYNLIKKNFKGQPRKSTLEPILDINHQRRFSNQLFKNQTQPKIHIFPRENFRESFIFIMFPIPIDYFQPENNNVCFALFRILDSIGNTGRIHTRLRTQEGFIYSHQIFIFGKFVSLFLFFQTHPKYAAHAIKSAVEEIYRLTIELVSSVELKTIKEDTLKNPPLDFIASPLEEHAYRFENYLEQENLSPIVKYQRSKAFKDEIQARIDAEVTPEAIRDMAAKIFVPEHLNVFIMGKIPDSEIKL